MIGLGKHRSEWNLPAMMIGHVPDGFQRVDLLIVIVADGADALLVFVVEKDVLQTKRALLRRASTARCVYLFVQLIRTQR